MPLNKESKPITEGWVWFCGISTTVGYLMPNTVFTSILNIYIGFVNISQQS